MEKHTTSVMQLIDNLLRVLRAKCLLHAFPHLPSLLSHSSMEQKYLPLNVKIDETNLLQFTHMLSFSVAEQKLCKELLV